MGNPPIGNNFFEGVLGVVNLKFNSVDLGKTLDEAVIEFIEDIKDIIFAQNGTQPYDQVPTGQAYKLTCKLGQPTIARLDQLMRGITPSGDGNSALLTRDIYRSGRANFAKVLEVTRVDSDGNSSTNPRHKLTFWLAFPKVSGGFATYGADTQRAVDVEFYIFFDDTAGHNGFGYSGFGSSLGIS